MLSADLREEIRALYRAIGSSSLVDLAQLAVESGIYRNAVPNEEERLWDVRAALSEPDANGVPLALELRSRPLSEPYEGPPTHDAILRKLSLLMAAPWLAAQLEVGEVALLTSTEALTYIARVRSRWKDQTLHLAACLKGLRDRAAPEIDAPDGGASESSIGSRKRESVEPSHSRQRRGRRC